MSKSKKTALIISVIAVWVIVVVGVVLAKSGKLPFIKRNEARPSGNTGVVQAEQKKKRAVPEKVNGVYLLAGTDFETNPELSLKQIQESIDLALKDTVDYSFNTIYVSALSEKNPIIISSSEGKLDILKYISEKAHKMNLYVVATVDYADVITTIEKIKVNDTLVKKLAQYDVDSLLLTNISGIDTASLTGEPAAKAEALSNAVKQISDTAKEANKIIEVGSEVSPVWAHSYHDPSGSKTSSYYESFTDSQLDTKGWVKNNLIDYIMIDSDNSVSRANANYKTCLAWWDEVVEGTGVSMYAKHRNDLVCTDNTTWSNSDELSRQYMAVSELKNCSGSAYYNLSNFKADRGSSTTRFLSFLKGELDIKNVLTDLIITNQTKSTINTSESKISFTGTGDPSTPITLNGKELERTDEGYFSVVADLKAGKNIFTFANKGQTKTFTVNYTLDVIKSISPKGSAYGIGETSITIKAEALKGAAVYATINGQRVSMSEGSANASEDDLANKDSMDYVTFTGAYKLPKARESVQKLGAIKVYGSYKGHSDSETGATVYVNAQVKTASVGMVTSALAETFDALTLDGKYNPTFAPLPKGTYDYIAGEATIDNLKFYKLSSGRLVYAKDFAAVSTPSTLSTNQISAVSAANIGKTTQLKLKTGWWVPFDVKFNPQAYFKGYDSRIFNVANFTASYVDIIFYYTNSGSGGMDFSSSNVVSNAQWINVGKNDTSTLRLNLKKAGAFYGYEITHDDSSGCFVITIKNKPSSLSNYTVLLDPGHGGRDPGALGAVIDPATGKNYYESKVNLSIATLVSNKLKALGANVIMTRTADTTFELANRAEYITAQKPDLSVSIHCDSSTNATATGTSAYYFKPYSQPLAKEVHDNLLIAWNNIYGRPIQNRKTNFYPFRIARIEVCPAILIECGFMSNPTEVAKLIDPASQDKLAAAITDGIVSYINKY